VNLINVIRLLAVFSWLAVIALVVLIAVRAARRQPAKRFTTALIATIVTALVINILAAGLVFIEPTERGVVISAWPGAKGVRQQALQPGLNWIVPFFDRVVTYPISRQTYTMSIADFEGERSGDDSVEARTSDGQVIKVDASVIFAIDPARVVDVHIQWQDTYKDGLVRTLSRGVIRDAVSGFGVEEVYSSQRLALTQQVSSELAERLEKEGFMLIDFVMRNIAFSDEYAASVEQKQIAEQLAEQAKFVVEQRRQEAEQARQQAQGEADAQVIRAQAEAQSRLIEAEAEAEALAKLGEAIRQNPNVLTLEYIQKISPGIEVMLVPNDNPFLLPFPDVNNP
jgi:regulator of protease activity HflC (stomatin/prohibitin superfamily)